MNLLKKVGSPVVLTVYQAYLSWKKRLFNSYSTNNVEFLTAVIQRYGTYFAAFIIVVFTVSHNLQASAGTSSLINNNSIFYSFLGNIPDEELIEERANQFSESSFARRYNSGQSVGNLPIPELGEESEEEPELPSAISGGNTLLKPIISSDEEAAIFEDQKLLDEITEYTVQNGDTISGIARKFGISINTILWENNMRARDYIRPGQTLTVLPTSGIRHTIKRGESLGRIASKYNIEVENILAFNQIADPGKIQPGQKLLIPEGTPLLSAPQAPAQKSIVQRLLPQKPAEVAHDITGMIWPTPGKVVTQYWNWRHNGLDIDGVTGDPIYSVADGKIVTSGWNSGGYGLQVIIDHGNGVTTRYAHCSKLLHKIGTNLKQGDVACLMGSTGRSTGSHLHFEVMVNGVRRNPMQYVKK